MSSNFVMIKARLEDEVHRFSLDASASFAQLQDTLRAVFFAGDRARAFTVKYEDEDGDLVSLSTDGELYDALREIVNGSDARTRVFRIVLVPQGTISAPFTPVSGVSATPATPSLYPRMDFETLSAAAPPAPTAAFQPVQPPTRPIPASVPSAPAAEPQQQPAKEQQQDKPEAAESHFFGALDRLLEHPEVAQFVNNPFLGGTLYLGLPRIAEFVLSNHAELGTALNAPRFLQEYLPRLLSAVVLPNPYLAAALARPETDRVLSVFAPAAADALRAFLAEHADAYTEVARQYQGQQQQQGDGGVDVLLPMLERLFTGGPSTPAESGAYSGCGPQGCPRPPQFGGLGGLASLLPLFLGGAGAGATAGGPCAGQGRPPHCGGGAGAGFGPFGGFGGPFGGGFGGPWGGFGRRHCHPHQPHQPHQQPQQPPQQQSQEEEDYEHVDQQDASGDQQPHVHVGVSCDGCQTTPITGNRYKCTVCYDFDLCAACEAAGKHDPAHPLLLMKVPRKRHHWGWGARHHQRNTRQETAPTATATATTTAAPTVDQQPTYAPPQPVPQPATAPAAAAPPVQGAAAAFEEKLQQLEAMGFVDRELNIQLLVRWSGNVTRVVQSLLESATA